MNTYLLLKTAHIFGALMVLGNIIVTAWWKNMADLNGDPKVVAFAQRQVTLTDFIFTAGGAVILIASGVAIAETQNISYFDTYWLKWGLALFIISGAIWVCILIPIQIKQARLAKSFAGGSEIPDEYWRLGKLWNLFGSVAVILPLAVLYFMVIQPD